MGLYRGSIHLVDFNPARGGEIGKVRPALLLSDELHNEFLETIIVIPLSTHPLQDAEPYSFAIGKRENLKEDSWLCIDEIRSLSKKRVKEKIASVSDSEYKEIKKSLCEII